MTTGVVIFDPAAFKVRYPEFASLDNGLLESYFSEATLFLDNTQWSLVRQIERRTPLLWMLTAHLAMINGGTNGQQPSGLVGRIDSATEGSVTVSAAMASTVSASAAYFQQTKYGAQFWQATNINRRFRYVPGASGPAPRPMLPGRWPWVSG